MLGPEKRIALPPLSDLDRELLGSEAGRRRELRSLRAAVSTFVVSQTLAAKKGCPGLEGVDPTMARINVIIRATGSGVAVDGVRSIVVDRGAPVASADIDCLTNQLGRSLPRLIGAGAVPPGLVFSGDVSVPMYLKNAEACGLNRTQASR